MTIEEAKYELDYCIRDMIEQKSHNDDKALDIAVKSLEAWEKVKAEIDEQYDRIKPYNIFCAEGLEMALGIIDKHLQGESDE